jgi:NADPH-dependent ferric siderophore reductase
VPEPAASVRLLLPEVSGLVIPEWSGNEFRFADGSRATIRTLTPVAVDPTAGMMALEVVRHGAGRAAEWAGAARPGDDVAVSGPARGYVPAPEATDFVIGGDETAIPALAQVAGAIPATRPVRMIVEIATPTARRDLTDRPDVVPDWIVTRDGEEPGAALAEAFTRVPIGSGTHVWVAGEAAAMQRVRRHLFGARGVERARATVRGYWKTGRTAGGG